MVAHLQVKVRSFPLHGDSQQIVYVHKTTPRKLMAIGSIIIGSCQSKGTGRGVS
jgi:hypothetical protein